MAKESKEIKMTAVINIISFLWLLTNSLMFDSIDLLWLRPKLQVQQN